jgi:hypothetical protein
VETSAVMFLACPAYLDAHGATRCGLPAEVQERYVLGSTDGPLESMRIQCPRGHWFNGPLESLIWDQQQQQQQQQEQQPAAGPALSTRRAA